MSCLCVTQPGRESLLAEAVACFDAQDYPDKDLVIVLDPKDGRTLGDLRNEALDRAGGDYLAIWDDDDLSHPTRLSVQVAALQRDNTDAAFVGALTFRCSCGFVGVTPYRGENNPWENSMVATRRVNRIRYPALGRGEDTVFAERLIDAGLRFTIVNDPGLYTYRYHGGNTWGDGHWASLLAGMRNPHPPGPCPLAVAR